MATMCCEACCAEITDHNSARGKDWTGLCRICEAAYQDEIEREEARRYGY